MPEVSDAIKYSAQAGVIYFLLANPFTTSLVATSLQASDTAVALLMSILYFAIVFTLMRRSSDSSAL